MMDREQALTIFNFSFEAMAASGEITLAWHDAEEARALALGAMQEVKRIEQKFSRYLPDSVISLINRAAGQDWVGCDEETVSLLDYADSLYQLSDGLFDITSGVLRQAWDFKNALVPTAEVLDSKRACIGWHDVERQGDQIRLSRLGMELDFGGFGKEYAADRAAEVLMGQGVAHGYANLAGDIRVIGPKPDGQAWNIGIQHPRETSKVLATIPLEQGGLATSGDYERFFEVNGKRYCHVLDPRNGMPVNYWQSISVLAPRAVIAGSCSTIAMLKQADGLAFLEASGMDYLAVDSAGQIHLSNV